MELDKIKYDVAHHKASILNKPNASLDSLPKVQQPIVSEVEPEDFFNPFAEEASIESEMTVLVLRSAALFKKDADVPNVRQPTPLKQEELDVSTTITSVSSPVDFAQVSEAPTSLYPDKLALPACLEPKKLAFEVAFILSCDRALKTVVYPLFDTRFSKLGTSSHVNCDTAKGNSLTFHYPNFNKLSKPRFQTRNEINTLLLIAGIEPDPGPKHKNKTSKRGKRKGKSKHPASAGNTFHLRKGLGFPDSWTADLEYIIPLQQVLGGGTTNCLRFTSNAYDVDTALASTAMASFTELAAVYSRFRTLRLSYDFKVSNSEAFPLGLIYGIMTNSVSATALGQNYAGNPHMYTTICSNVNGSTSSRRLRGGVSATTLFGSKQPLYDDLFIGSTTSSTLSSTATMNCYIGAVSSAIPVAGWFVTGFIKLKVLFLRRNAILV